MCLFRWILTNGLYGFEYFTMFSMLRWLRQLISNAQLLVVLREENDRATHIHIFFNTQFRTQRKSHAYLLNLFSFALSPTLFLADFFFFNFVCRVFFSAFVLNFKFILFLENFNRCEKQMQFVRNAIHFICRCRHHRVLATMANKAGFPWQAKWCVYPAQHSATSSICFIKPKEKCVRWKQYL